MALLDQFTTTNIASASTDEAGVAATADMRLMGYSIKETAASTATMSLHNGTSASGAALAYINLASGGSVTEWFGPQGIPCAGGVWIERLTGSTAVILHTKVMS